MRKMYEQPLLEIITFDNHIQMTNASVTIDYPWNNETNNYQMFE